MPLWIREFWNWVLYYRRGRIKYWVWDEGNLYNVSASNGTITVFNCYGGTPEQAKEMALFRLKKALNKEEKEMELVVKGDGYSLYREK